MYKKYQIDFYDASPPSSIANNNNTSILIYLFISLLLITNATSQTIIGPQPCPSNASVNGYTNTTALQTDITVEAYTLLVRGMPLRPPPYTYILCPQTTFDISQTSPLTPLLGDTVIMCGSNGNRTEGNCVFTGGRTHVIFQHGTTYRDVYIAGITFRRATKASVVARGGFDSTGIFHDCSWEMNGGPFVVYIHSPEDEGVDGVMDAFFNNVTMLEDETNEVAAAEVGKKGSKKGDEKGNKGGEKERGGDRRWRGLQYDSNSKGMLVVFQFCSFRYNINEAGTILSFDGDLLLYKTTFFVNQASYFTVGMIEDGKLFMQESTFLANQNLHLGPVFVDHSSNLWQNNFTSGDKNAMGTCQGVAIESNNSRCVNSQMENCEWSCCAFGDNTCAGMNVVGRRDGWNNGENYPSEAPSFSSTLYWNDDEEIDGGGDNDVEDVQNSTVGGDDGYETSPSADYSSLQFGSSIVLVILHIILSGIMLLC